MTRSFTLQAAHYIQYKDSAISLKAKDIILTFGTNNLDNLLEPGVVVQSVAEIHVHPDWNAWTQRFDADIAMLIMEDPIAFTRYIKPICIWVDGEVDVKSGIVTGWGRDENDSNGKHLKQLTVPLETNEICYYEDYNFAKISSLRTFCAGSRNGSGVCNGSLKNILIHQFLILFNF